MAYHVAIDLGTSYFRAGLVGGDTIIREPSAVARDTLGRLVIGEAAERMVGRHPQSVEVVYPIQAGSVKDYDGAVAILRYIVKNLIPKQVFNRLDITLALSETLTPVERRALEEATREAGANNVHFFNALTAAAVGANLPISEPVGCLLVNLGGGATEVALLSLGGIVDCRKLSIGGRTVNEEIIDWVRKEKAFLIGVHTAEQLKRHTNEQENEVSVKGRNLVTGLPEQIQISSCVVRDTFSSYYDSVVNLVVETMEACPPELVGDIMDHGIVLVGGGATDEKILKNLTSRTEVPIIIADSPETCVIRGLMKQPLKQ